MKDDINTYKYFKFPEVDINKSQINIYLSIYQYENFNKNDNDKNEILNILINDFFKDNSIIISNTRDNSSYNILPIKLKKSEETAITTKYFTGNGLECVYKITCTIEQWSPKLYIYIVIH